MGKTVNQRREVSFAERMADERELQGETRSGLARKAGISRQGLINLEAGAEPKVSTVRAIAQALGVRVGWLMFGTGAKKGPE